MVSGTVARGGGYDGTLDWQGTAGKLGYVPYPGTLNVVLERPFLVREGISLINDFIAVPGRINGHSCHVCVKEPGIEPNPCKVWIIAPYNLRDALNLVDGDRVQVTLYYY